MSGKKRLVGSKDTDLPNGWRMKTMESKIKNKNGFKIRYDAYYYGPGKKVVRSFVDLRKHFGDTLSLDGFNFKTGRFEGGSSTHNKVSSVSSSRKPKKSVSEMNTNPESMAPDTISKKCKSEKHAVKMPASTEILMAGKTSVSNEPMDGATEMIMSARSALSTPVTVVEIIKRTESMAAESTSTSRKPIKHTAETSMMTNESKVTGTTFKMPEPIKRLMAKSTLDCERTRQTGEMSLMTEVMAGTTSDNSTPKSKKQASKMLMSNEILMAGTTSNNSHNYMKRTSEASTTSEGATSKKQKSILRDDAEMRVVKGTTHKGVSINFEKEVDTREQTSADNDDDESNQSSIDFHSQLDSKKNQITASQLVNTIFKSFEDNEESDHLRKRILSEKRDLLKKCTEAINERAAKKNYTKPLTKPKTAADIEKLIRQRKEICEKMLAFLVENN